MSKQTIGWIGLGAMGLPMAQHVMAAGYPLAVYARRAESAAPLVAQGAQYYATPAQMAGQCDVVITMVTAATDFEAVVFGEHGICHSIRPGSVVIDMETISPTVARAAGSRLSGQGVAMLDAPVSGGPMGAAAASLSIMVGGTAADLARVQVLLGCMGKTITHVGESGAGQITKACNQLALLVTAQGVAEALHMASSLGADPALVRQVLLGGVASSRVLELFGERMVQQHFEHGIDTRLYHKDMAIILELAHSAGLALPCSALVMQQINALMGQGRGREDLAALITVLAQTSKPQLKE
jgi:2-hydroxy-3-oxopropionate reductase